MKIWKSSGILLIITGILHCIVALALGWEQFAAMIKDGVVNSVGDDPDRSLALWFMMTGIVVLLLGQVVHYCIVRTDKPAPRSLGWSLLVLSLAGGLIEPLSGFWLFIPQGVIIICANRKRA